MTEALLQRKEKLDSKDSIEKQNMLKDANGTEIHRQGSQEFVLPMDEVTMLIYNPQEFSRIMMEHRHHTNILPTVSRMNKLCLVLDVLPSFVTLMDSSRLTIKVSPYKKF